MSEQQRAEVIRKYLENHKDEFENDPNDDSFWVHTKILDAVGKGVQGFEALKESRINGSPMMFEMMKLQLGGQLEVFVTWKNLKKYFIGKGDDLCVFGIQEFYPFEDEAETIDYAGRPFFEPL